MHHNRSALYSMNEKEAIEHMGLLSHDSFFVFYNVDTDAVNVVYRLSEGGYGLTMPEIG